MIQRLEIIRYKPFWGNSQSQKGQSGCNDKLVWLDCVDASVGSWTDWCTLLHIIPCLPQHGLGCGFGLDRKRLP